MVRLLRLKTLLVLTALLCFSIGCSDTSNSIDRPGCTQAISSDPGFAISDCYKIHFEVFGEGEPIILVHGWSLNIESNWKSTGWIEALQAVRQVIVIDIRGHGSSDKPYVQEAYSYSRMAQDILAVMDHLGIARADVLGYSLGSFSGVHLLGHNQDRLKSVIMMGIGDENEESIAEAPV
jgi:pimeloyl-ACP methyl ester carboxylesterase